MSSSPIDAATCAVCLHQITAEVGQPDACQHVFCLRCIREWAKVINTCPVDRLPFTHILVKNEIAGPVILKTAAPRRQAPAEEEPAEEEDATYCEVCAQSDREDRLLLCDGCDAGFHLECLTPALDAVPLGEWFCPDCAPDAPAPQTDTARRLIARTEVAERVRERLAVSDAEEEEDDDEGSDSTDGELVDMEQQPDEPASSMPPKKRYQAAAAAASGVTAEELMAQQSARLQSKRSAGAKRAAKKPGRPRKTGGRKKRVVRRRRRRRRKTTKKAKSSPQKASLGALGQMLPRSVQQSSAGSGSQDAASSSNQLYLFGNDKQLLHFSDEESDDEGPLSRNARRFDRPVERVKLPKITKTARPVAAPSSAVLDEILTGQDVLHAPAACINIHGGSGRLSIDKLKLDKQKDKQQRNQSAAASASKPITPVSAKLPSSSSAAAKPKPSPIKFELAAKTSIKSIKLTTNKQKQAGETDGEGHGDSDGHTSEQHNRNNISEDNNNRKTDQDHSRDKSDDHNKSRSEDHRRSKEDGHNKNRSEDHGRSKNDDHNKKDRTDDRGRSRNDDHNNKDRTEEHIRSRTDDHKRSRSDVHNRNKSEDRNRIRSEDHKRPRDQNETRSRIDDRSRNRTDDHRRDRVEEQNRSGAEKPDGRERAVREHMNERPVRDDRRSRADVQQKDGRQQISSDKHVQLKRRDSARRSQTPDRSLKRKRSQSFGTSDADGEKSEKKKKKKKHKRESSHKRDKHSRERDRSPERKRSRSHSDRRKSRASSDEPEIMEAPTQNRTGAAASSSRASQKQLPTTSSEAEPVRTTIIGSPGYTRFFVYKNQPEQMIMVEAKNAAAEVQSASSSSIQTAQPPLPAVAGGKSERQTTGLSQQQLWEHLENLTAESAKQQQQAQQQRKHKLTDYKSVKSTSSSKPSSQQPVPVPAPLTAVAIAEAHSTVPHTSKQQSLDRRAKIDVFKQNLRQKHVTRDKLDAAVAKYEHKLDVEAVVKAVLLPKYTTKQLSKEQYKQVLRATVPKVCSRSRSVNVSKISAFVEAYVAKVTAGNNNKGRSDSRLLQPYSPTSNASPLPL